MLLILRGTVGFVTTHMHLTFTDSNYGEEYANQTYQYDLDRIIMDIVFVFLSLGNQYHVCRGEGRGDGTVMSLS